MSSHENTLFESQVLRVTWGVVFGTSVICGINGIGVAWILAAILLSVAVAVLPLPQARPSDPAPVTRVGKFLLEPPKSHAHALRGALVGSVVLIAICAAIGLFVAMIWG